MESEWLGLEWTFTCHPVQPLCNNQDPLQILQIWLNTVSATGFFFSHACLLSQKIVELFFPVCFSGAVQKRKIPSMQKCVCCATGVGAQAKYCFSSFFQLLTQPACCNAAMILDLCLKTETTTSCAVIQE